MTTLPQAEIDAAVKLAERTVVQAPLHKSHYAEFDAVTLARAILALAAEREWRPTPAQIVAAMTASFLVQGFAYPDALDLYETANFILALKPPTPAGEGG